MLPCVSVIVPMRNAQRFVHKALDSIFDSNSDTVEVIVIDDRSTDGSVDSVTSRHDARIRLLHSTGAGISAALNLGLDEAKAPVIMRCDADDLYTVGRITRQLDWLDEHAEYGAVCGGFSAIDSRGRLLAVLPTGPAASDITEELLAGHTRTSLCTFAIRTHIARRIGGFREYFETAEDIDFQLRLVESTSIMYLPQSCYCWRLHDASITHTQSRQWRTYYEQTARSHRKQRQMAGQDDLQAGREPVLQGALDDSGDKVQEQIMGFITGAAWAAHAQGEKLRGLRVAARALRYSPFSYFTWRTLAALLFKPVRT